MPATRAHIPRILLVFDFDRTLGSDSIDAIVAEWGTSREEWESRFVEPLGGRWDGILRRGWALIEAGRAHDDPISADLLSRAAARIELYDEVTSLPERLRSIAHEISEDIELEFHVLSSGYADLISATAIEDTWDRIWASTFHYDDDGRAVTVKRLVSHPDKALYLEALGKGLDPDGREGANGRGQAGQHVDEHDRHVPFDQMVYVGDGQSDLQAFGFIESHGGFAIAVDDDDHFDAEDEQQPDQRVENLARPTYAEGSELFESLAHCVRICASLTMLRSLGRGE